MTTAEHPNAIEAMYADMRNKGQLYVGQLGGNPITIEDWRDIELMRWRDLQQLEQGLVPSNKHQRKT